MNDIVPPNDIEQLKSKVMLDIQSDRKAWRITTIPQIATLLILSIVLSCLAAFGVYNSVTSLVNGGDVATLQKGVEVFVTGSSSLLGFVVLKLFGKLKESTEAYIMEEKRFTSDKNMVHIAESREEINGILKSYYKIGSA